MSFIPLMTPAIPEAAIEGVAEVLRSGMLVQGQNVAAFESEVGRYLGAKNVIAVSNGTATLHLALLAAALVALLVLRRGVVETLLVAGAVGVVIQM